jgi:hypothetical protein
LHITGCRNSQSFVLTLQFSLWAPCVTLHTSILYSRSSHTFTRSSTETDATAFVILSHTSLRSRGQRFLHPMIHYMSQLLHQFSCNKILKVLSYLWIALCIYIYICMHAHTHCTIFSLQRTILPNWSLSAALRTLIFMTLIQQLRLCSINRRLINL